MLLLKNGCLIDVEKSTVSKKDILIDGKTIKAVEDKIEISEVETVDLAGKFVFPGIIDAHCHLGMWEDSMGFEGSDGNEVADPVTPHLRAIDAINPFDKGFKEALEAGITTVMTGPGSANPIGGQFALMKTFGRSVDEMVINAPAAMKMALGENPKRVYSEQKKSPMTRMATAAIIREWLYKARRYANDIEKNGESKVAFDIKLDALVPVVKKKLPVKIHCHRADDIQTAIRIANEFDLDYTLDHATDAYRIAEILKEEKAKLIIGPLLSERSKIELESLSMKNPKLLSDCGLEFAMMTDHPVIPEKYLPLIAELAVREGLDEWTAMKMITINAAKILNVENRIGSIAIGKDADIVVFNSHPLSGASINKVYVDGVLRFEG